MDLLSKVFFFFMVTGLEFSICLAAFMTAFDSSKTERETSVVDVMISLSLCHEIP